jgi:hypothetical protein
MRIGFHKRSDQERTNCQRSFFNINIIALIIVFQEKSNTYNLFMCFVPSQVWVTFARWFWKKRFPVVEGREGMLAVLDKQGLFSYPTGGLIRPER